MEKRTIGFKVDLETRSGQPDAIIVRAMARVDEGASPINPSCANGEDATYGAPKAAHGLDLHSFQVKIWRSSRDGEWHHASPIYGERYLLDAGDVERMHRTLAKVTKAIRKANAVEAGDVIMAVAGAIGATFTVEQRYEEPYSMYRDVEWRWHPVTRARDKVRDMMKAPAEKAA